MYEFAKVLPEQANLIFFDYTQDSVEFQFETENQQHDGKYKIVQDHSANEADTVISFQHGKKTGKDGLNVMIFQNTTLCAAATDYKHQDKVFQFISSHTSDSTKAVKVRLKKLDA